MTTTATTPRERGILFNGEMVRAILDGRKTQTRRPCRWPKWAECCDAPDRCFTPHNLDDDCYMRISACERCQSPGSRPGAPWCRGDMLYVRETLAWHDGALFYDADSAVVEYVPDDAKPITRPRLPSMFMPKWAARIWLEVVSVRVERVQEISVSDVRAEGSEVKRYEYDAAPQQWGKRWNAIYTGEQSWDSNPWVWVCEFRRIER